MGWREQVEEDQPTQPNWRQQLEETPSAGWRTQMEEQPKPPFELKRKPSALGTLAELNRGNYAMFGGGMASPEVGALVNEVAARTDVNNPEQFGGELAKEAKDKQIERVLALGAVYGYPYYGPTSLTQLAAPGKAAAQLTSKITLPRLVGAGIGDEILTGGAVRRSLSNLPKTIWDFLSSQ